MFCNACHLSPPVKGGYCTRCNSARARMRRLLVSKMIASSTICDCGRAIKQHSGLCSYCKAEHDYRGHPAAVVQSHYIKPGFRREEGTNYNYMVSGPAWGASILTPDDVANGLKNGIFEPGDILKRHGKTYRAHGNKLYEVTK